MPTSVIHNQGGGRNLPAKTPIKLSKDTVETQFIFFYDLGVRIVETNFSQEQRKREHHEKVGAFVWRDVAQSEMSQFYFSQNFLEKLVPIHMHANLDELTIDNFLPVKNTKPQQRSFHFVNRPLGIQKKIESYSPIELSIFRNGSLVITIRLNNEEEITDEEYLEAIRNPEFTKSRNFNHVRYKPGYLVDFACKVVDEIESQLADCINELGLKVVSLKSESTKTLKIIPRSDEKESEEDHDKGFIYRSLDQSRPYIGTIIDFKNGNDIQIVDSKNDEAENQKDNETNIEIEPQIDDDVSTITDTSTIVKTKSQLVIEKERILDFAIAAARTTPGFLTDFDNAEAYLLEEIPKRNIYHPGPSIVFIARRGWVCFKMEERDEISFQIGVTEIVLLVIQAILSSVRATRRFTCEVIEEGSQVDIEFNTGKQGKYPVKAPLSGITVEKIHNFTSFLARARINAPFDDMTSLISAHINTHTGIAAVHRLKELTGLDDLSNKASQTLENYGKFLDIANQVWNTKKADIARKRFYVSIGSMIATLFGAGIFKLFV